MFILKKLQLLNGFSDLLVEFSFDFFHRWSIERIPVDHGADKFIKLCPQFAFGQF